MRGGFWMKDKLLELINQIDTVKSHFKTSGASTSGFPVISTIYNTPEFSEWSQALQFELQEIHDRTHDKFIWSTLVIIEQGFNGWKDTKSFADLSGKLHAIQENIDRYYPVDALDNSYTMEVGTVETKTPKIFISHSSKDVEYVSALVDLLCDIGLNAEHIFCSSVPGYGIPLDHDIYDFLKQQFQEHDLHVFFILSDNYYDSPACLNEMGATWILQTNYTSILLPGFEFRKIDGAINPRKIAIKLDGLQDDLKEKLGQLKDNLIAEFGLPNLPSIRWEKKRDEFIAELQPRSFEVEIKISSKAIELLSVACKSSNGEIIRSRYLSGTSISAGKTEFIHSQDRKEVAEWEAALKELRALGLVEAMGAKGEIYEVTKAGYDFIENYSAVSGT